MEQVTGDEGETVIQPVSRAVLSKLGLWSQLLHTAASPALAYILLCVAVGLLIFEFFTAGIGVAGVVGAGALVLSGYGLGVLPTRTWALVVLGVGAVAFAIDVQAGILLWELKLGESARWSGPVTGEGRLVFLSKLHALPPRALVVDVYRGRIEADFKLPAADPASALEETSWIEDDALFVPVFNRRGPPSRIDAFKLESGERTWTIEFGADEELHSVLHHEGKDYLVTVGARAGNTTGNGAVYLLDGEFGTLGARLKVQSTSSAVNGDPSWNVTPLRSLNSQVVSSIAFQLSARPGIKT